LTFTPWPANALGYIRDMLIDEHSGSVAYAVLGLAGFHGCNERWRGASALGLLTAAVGGTQYRDGRYLVASQ
jgi:hypothetical protein